MKKYFFDLLFQEMATNPDIYLIFIDLGWPRVEEFLQAYPQRALTTGAAEQTALDIAVGLSYSGKIPFVYTITPFFYRGFETIRTYINHENLNVKMIGAGRDNDYSKNHGYSHDARDAHKVFSIFPKIIDLYPINDDELKLNLTEIINNPRPYFLSLKR